MGGVSILFRGGHFEVEISSCCGVYFLGGIEIYMGGSTLYILVG